MELDIYIPSIKLGIEYDGEAWHRGDKIERETKKCKICHEHGIKLIRLKENFLEVPNREKYRYTADRMLSIQGNMYEHDKLSLVIQQLLDDIDPRSNIWTRRNPWMIHSPVEINISRDERAIREYMTKIKSGSFGELYPELAKEWHPTKNGNVTPYKVKPHSKFEAWLVCPQCGKEYQAPIGRRASGGGCADCGRLKSIKSRSKRIQMIDRVTNEVIRTFESAAEAYRKTGISDGNIHSVLRGKRTHAGGYFWRLETDEMD